MPISIVVGGQYGSEGKGKVAHYLCKKLGATFAVRCGGSNSGHTVIDEKGAVRIFQHLPTAAILPDVKLAICAGSYIDLSILQREIKETEVDSNRLIIDPDAVIITDELKVCEKNGGLISAIGSTGSGTGAAVAARVNREEILRAKDVKELTPYLQDVPDVLRDCLGLNERVVIEGTQGFGLSPLHSRNFPYTTSRDTTAAAFLSETGLSPLDVDDVVLTIRTFPIRVAGNSGPLENEIDWETVTREGNHKILLQEKTSVTKKVRRVGRFSKNIVKTSIYVNNPTRIVLNHLDFIKAGATQNCLEVKDFVDSIEKDLDSHISLLGFGPESNLKENR